ncbi:MAG TPA: hypothetical protein VIH17_07825 [Candidatus Acidoferrales bacterium]
MLPLQDTEWSSPASLVAPVNLRSSLDMVTTLLGEPCTQGLVQYTRRNLTVYPERVQQFLRQIAR